VFQVYCQHYCIHTALAGYPGTRQNYIGVAAGGQWMRLMAMMNLVRYPLRVLDGIEFGMAVLAF